MGAWKFSFRITSRGLLLGVISLTLASLGIYRREMASLFWGLGIGSLILLSLSSVSIASYWVYRKKDHLEKHIQLIRPPNPQLAETEIPFQIQFPASVLNGLQYVPGVVLRFSYRVFSWNKRVFEWSALLSWHSPFLTHTPTPPPRRGDYIGPVGILGVEDCFGFCLGEIPLTLEERLLVLPKPYPFSLSPLKTAEGGTRFLAPWPLKTRTEELEIRKYIPGDDVRRLHWKLFAHSGELFLRVREEDPPPTETVYLHFDPTLPEGL
ncbi:MAG: DUF58 domain-containing protein, partial [Spirochaetales bacterium]